MDREARFFAEVAGRQMVRTSVRAIVLGEPGFLVQRPTDGYEPHYAFIGGEYEVGDHLLERLQSEFEEETSAKIVRANYRFVVENRFASGNKLVHALEHYFEVEIDRLEVTSKEPHLTQRWLSAEVFAEADVRPAVVRDLLLSPGWRQVRHVVVPLPSIT